MKFSFGATIYKVGINLCVDVPLNITKKMTVAKGYIPIKGKIKNHFFQQTLVPIKNAAYRLYVNGPMLKCSNTKLGDNVKFIIEQDTEPRTEAMRVELKKELNNNNLLSTFNKLTAGRQKEILRYLNNLKTAEAQARNIDKIISQLKKKNMETQLP
ncbi:MAG TPA: YdeI/OmpD-associated family protein [Ferruginibacter sp.]|nr:YdeI/OmpD-associated family protein [Ferruginibacter sp.]